MANREHEYEIKFNSGHDKTIRVWWDGKRVACDNPRFHDSLQDEGINGVTILSGIRFLEALPQRYNNGYISCYPVDKSDDD